MNRPAPDLTAPRRLARGGVGLAVHALPAGQIRDRYRQELLADMYGMSRHTQIAYTLGVLTHIWALRAAVVADAPAISEVTMSRRPFTCRTNLHHVWRWQTADDGSRYRRCARCGKDHSGISKGDPNSLGGAFG
ncbi:MAG TPA: hypothetical protein VH502_07150 [Actinoplanes sp.]|jgi:hypothetical protein